MIVLSMDTAHAACSVCVYDSVSGSALANLSEPMRQGHAERLADMVDEAVSAANLTVMDVDRLAVCSGPGTFTGVRIALSFARGLSLVIRSPVIPVTTFQALATSALPFTAGKPVWIVQDARRGEVYLQCFGSDAKPCSDAEVLTCAQASRRISGNENWVAGSGSELLELSNQTRIVDISPIPDAEVIARLAVDSDSVEGQAVPFYLRPPDAKAQQPLVKHRPDRICIKQVGSDHAGILSEIHRRCFEDAWDEKAMADLLATPGTTALLALDENESASLPCGFVMFRKAADEIETFSLAVLPNKRRRNIASSLMNELVRLTREAGGGRIFIEYADTNEAARALYERLGYEPVGRRSGYYRNSDGTSHNAITAVLNVPAT